MNLDFLNNLGNALKENKIVQNFMNELSNYLEKVNNDLANQNINTVKTNSLKQENTVYQVVEIDVDGAYLQNTINNRISKEIDIPKGQHTLTVVLVDINNKTITKKQEVKGVIKPTISVSVDNPENPTEFIIKASDEVELDAITFIINDDENQKYIVRAEGKKELEQRFPLQDGENRIWATAYNIDGATAEFKGMAKK